MMNEALIGLPYILVTVSSLLFNSITDVKTRQIDSRLNYLSMGATIVLVVALSPSLLTLVGIAIVGIISQLMFRKFMSTGDFEALSWIYLFLGVYKIFNLIIFLVALSLISALSYLAIRFSLHKKDFKLPYYPIILGSYIISILF
jgi:hypothetical protein